MQRKSWSGSGGLITVKRDPGYYITKIIIPTIAIVGVTGSVFWMKREDLADRLGVSLTGVLTMVAYQFILAETLPRHIYNNLLDGMVLLSFGMLVLTIVENIAVNMLYLRDRDDSGDSIDRTCRWLFPVSYLFFLGILASIYLV